MPSFIPAKADPACRQRDDDSERKPYMPAYLIGHITVKDQSQWQIYVDGVGKSLAPFNAEVLFRGKRNDVLAGQHSHQQTVVIRFADQAELQSWFHSEGYQKLIPLRDRAADVVIISYDA
jgi:uncharacterized protein (DUF1330 family)